MEAPLSRVEAILQNILGADNVLVPPQSRVEAILLAILNNTEYIHPGDPSRVEEILLAIKDGGSYNKKALSRVEDILIHKLNDEEYTDYSEDDLSRVEKLLIQWIDLHPEVIKELTTSSFPISILANGLPLLDYRIDGNSVQSGTPTPDNPVMPQGTGERTGNLVAAEANHTNPMVGLSAVWKKDSSEMIINGKATGGDSARFAKFELDAGTYTLSITGLDETGWGKTGFYLSGVDTARVQGVRTYTIAEPTIARLQFVVALSDVSYENRKVTIMFTKTSTPLPYEPYGIKIPISSANTTTPVYLGEVETTRKIKKYEFTGQEAISQGSENYYTSLPAPGVPYSNVYCTHNVYGACRVNNNGGYIWFKISSWSDYATAEDLKAFFQQEYAAGTPVTVWYVLATEETGIVNEPLMKIGDYADTLSYAQAGEDVPTNEKPTETVIDVPTSVKPSEGYIKYTEPTDGPTPKTQVLGTKNHEIYMTSNDEVYVLRR